ncbi:MAG: sulfurtransferase-like selenium metabolism protein YedF [Peptococcaceae bacterium]|nr:sulfurtransferase-like selenium metabolism protein YedF [Peptococcaceae bacterium]
MPEIKKVDCRGLACPRPVIETKKALESMDRGTVITVVDNDTARENVTLFARNTGHGVEVEKINGNYHIAITKGGTGETRNEQIKELTPAVYLVTSSQLGQGSPDLGQVLMKSLMVTLSEMDRPPGALLFLNTGVMLTCQGSPVLEQIKILASKGVEIISCGTCLEYYKLKDKLEAGRVGNMMEINGFMTDSTKVITIS